MLLEMTRPVQGGLRQERKLETVSNNLANADTNAFKKDRISFDDEFRARINKDFSQGALQKTGNPLDLALSGPGFFKVETAEGIRYTRNGNFSLDPDGIVVDQNGHPVMGQAGAIALDTANPQEELHVNQAGEVYVDGGIVATLDVVTFADLDQIERAGQNLLSYSGPTTDEIPAAQASVHQRTLEMSNTLVVEEMARMIDYHRMFETFTKSMMTFDEVDATAINNVGTLR